MVCSSVGSHPWPAGRCPSRSRKRKPGESWGRKATGPFQVSRAAERKVKHAIPISLPPLRGAGRRRIRIGAIAFPWFPTRGHEARRRVLPLGPGFRFSPLLLLSTQQVLPGSPQAPVSLAFSRPKCVEADRTGRARPGWQSARLRRSEQDVTSAAIALLSGSSGIYGPLRHQSRAMPRGRSQPGRFGDSGCEP